MGLMQSMQDKPDLDKTCSDGSLRREGYTIEFGGAQMQGWRKYQEDRMVAYSEGWEERGLAFFAVFDGHGGSRTAEFCSQHLAEFMFKCLDRDTGGEITAEAVSRAFAEFDWMLCSYKDERRKHMSCGSTGTVVLVDTRRHRLWVAHVGDSRAIVFRPRSREMLHITHDHAPDDPLENRRISAVAMRADTPYSAITMRGNRVFVGGCSSLNVCRGFGDHDFKRTHGLHQSEQAVCCVPEVYEHRLDQEDGDLSVVIASDGIWGAIFTGQGRPKGGSINAQYTNWCVDRCIRGTAPYSAGLAESFDRLVAQRLPQLGKSTDNMAAYLLTIRQDRHAADGGGGGAPGTAGDQ